MAEKVKPKFIIQCIDLLITSDQVHELRDELDKDYSHIVGIAISDIYCSKLSVLEVVKVKGLELLPEGFEAAHVMSSLAVEPNKRFFSWFKPMPVSGDEMVIRFRDPEYIKNYNLQVQVLLTNNPEETINVLFG
ncbi:MAG: hypothetical protein A2W91_05545 [Bacteroidetes bacterium GWF2_38_335]|nr:MAG: hypothetical protein A2W91_05545 [Bacteroidetes bacterium GWF2_38_335]HBS88092.1 hypothetical protein [Bacteroidales bacterium]